MDSSPAGFERSNAIEDQGGSVFLVRHRALRLKLFAAWNLDPSSKNTSNATSAECSTFRPLP